MEIKHNENHECETLIKSKCKISVQKINGIWYWILWDDKKGNIANGIKHCPYCGLKL